MEGRDRMTIRLECGPLSCIIGTKGAEIVSLQYNGIEYIWQGDDDIWPYHAPVLFPCCGFFPDGYEAKGRTRHLKRHGFLRDEEHAYIGDGVFEYASSGREDYPYPFIARTAFTLEGSTLTRTLTVTNTGDSAMPFSMGFHTGYALSEPEIAFDDRRISVSDSSYDGTIFIPKCRYREAYVSDKSGKKLRLSFSDITTIVLWTVKGHADALLCIEPRIDTVSSRVPGPFASLIDKGRSATLRERIEILPSAHASR